MKSELAANSYESVRKKEEADKDKKKNGGGSGPVAGQDRKGYWANWPNRANKANRAY